jgi:hypothetical protein
MVRPASRLHRWVDRLRRRLIPAPVVVPPNVYRDRTFSVTTVEIDGDTFERCSFECCLIIYCGGPLSMSGCRFIGCQFAFGGDARRAIGFLSWMYCSGAAEDVEATFQAIRQSTHPDSSR